MALTLQPGEKKKVDVNFEADCDITFTQGVQHTKSYTEAEAEVPCNNDTHEESCHSSICVRGVQIELPDGSSDELSEV